MSGRPGDTADREASGRNPSIRDWLGALSGLAFVGLLLAGVMLGDPNSEERNTDPNQPGSAIAPLLVEHRDDAQLGITLSLVGIFCFIAFVTYLYSRIRRVQEDDWTPTLALGGGLVAAGFLLLQMNTALAATLIDDYGNEPAVARTLAALSWESILVLGTPLAAFVAGVSGATLRHGVLPGWLGWTGLPVSVALLIMPIAFIGFTAFVPWIVLVSLASLWRIRSAPAVAGSRVGPIPQAQLNV